MLNGGLSLGILPFWNPLNVYFQVQALVFNHTDKRMRDQWLFPNQSD